MPMVIVPVGLLMGPEFGADGPADRDPRYWEVHLGADPQRLSTEQLAVWAGAYRTPQQHARLQVTRERLEESLREDDGPLGRVTDPARIVSELLDRGLLIEYDPVDGALAEPFCRLRLFPQGQGLGSTSDDPTRYRIGFAGYPLAKVGRNVYQLWWYSLSAPSIWDACVRLAGGDERPASRADPLHHKAEDLAREMGAALPHMVSMGAAFLDPAPERSVAR
ncbi:MAG: hypothetical protein ACRDMV_03720 [Streptosporangiales bacterium]